LLAQTHELPGKSIGSTVQNLHLNGISLFKWLSYILLRVLAQSLTADASDNAATVSAEGLSEHAEAVGRSFVIEALALLLDCNEGSLMLNLGCRVRHWKQVRVTIIGPSNWHLVILQSEVGGLLDDMLRRKGLAFVDRLILYLKEGTCLLLEEVWEHF
jgi:hypothetical protein